MYRASRLLGFIDGSLEYGDDLYACRVRFADSEPFFAGHFPGHPVVPGLIMIEGLIALVERATGKKRTLAKMIEAKFRNAALPNDTLEYRVSGPGPRYDAKISCGGKDILQAKIELIDPDETATSTAQ